MKHIYTDVDIDYIKIFAKAMQFVSVPDVEKYKILLKPNSDAR